jgi:uncharacterized membrane protein
MATGTTPEHRSLRERLPFAPEHDPYFRWRGREVSRLEGFTDAVFAFAVTLLIVALEVPKTYEGLMEVVRAFPAFVICFVILMIFWNVHYRFFRRYGLEDGFTRLLTMAILVLVLFSVYPLKFLFGIVTAAWFGWNLQETPHLHSHEQIRNLYVIYGLGLAGVWTLYSALHLHVLRNRKLLELDAAELMQSKGALLDCLINVAVCLLSVMLAILSSSNSLPGFTYCLLAPLLTLNGVWFGRKVRALQTAKTVLAN